MLCCADSNGMNQEYSRNEFNAVEHILRLNGPFELPPVFCLQHHMPHEYYSYHIRLPFSVLPHYFTWGMLHNYQLHIHICRAVDVILNHFVPPLFGRTLMNLPRCDSPFYRTEVKELRSDTQKNTTQTCRALAPVYTISDAWTFFQDISSFNDLTVCR